MKFLSLTILCLSFFPLAFAGSEPENRSHKSNTELVCASMAEEYRKLEEDINKKIMEIKRLREDNQLDMQRLAVARKNRDWSENTIKYQEKRIENTNRLIQEVLPKELKRLQNEAEKVAQKFQFNKCEKG